MLLLMLLNIYVCFGSLSGFKTKYLKLIFLPQALSIALVVKEKTTAIMIRVRITEVMKPRSWKKVDK